MPCSLGADGWHGHGHWGNVAACHSGDKGVLSPGRSVRAPVVTLRVPAGAELWVPILAPRVPLSAPTRAPASWLWVSISSELSQQQVPFPSLERSENNQNKIGNGFRNTNNHPKLKPKIHPAPP